MDLSLLPGAVCGGAFPERLPISIGDVVKGDHSKENATRKYATHFHSCGIMLHYALSLETAEFFSGASLGQSNKLIIALIF